ncbi:MAG: diguanylate cyclase [Deltaproteobacteria bacterium]|nr:diguanylate cyclase [Deltaproteobacteria bacterium]
MANIEPKTPFLHILIVVESDADAQLVQAFLVKCYGAEFTSERVKDLATAVELLDTQKIDVVLLDLELPDSEGLDTLLSLQGHAPTQTILVITDNDDEELAVESLRYGAQDYLAKNKINVWIMNRAISYALGRKETEEELRFAKTEAERTGWELHEANERLTHEIAERKKLEKELEIQATTDPLTGLFNRRQGKKLMNKEASRVSRKLQDLSLIMMDIDHFKRVNDTYGHDAGDAVLVEVAGRLKDGCREYDSVVRWGGEEILIVCPETDSQHVEIVAERFREKLAGAPIEISDTQSIEVTASFGAASSEKVDNLSIESLITQCDNALYQAKKDGRNCVKIADFTDCSDKNSA